MTDKPIQSARHPDITAVFIDHPIESMLISDSDDSFRNARQGSRD